MSNYLITGGSRGLGLEFVRQFLQHPQSEIAKVFVTVRAEPPAALQELIKSSNGRVDYVHCEVTKNDSVKKMAADLDAKLSGAGLDVLINNVGVMPIVQGNVAAMDPQSLIDTFDTNVVAAHRVTSALIPLLQKGKEKKIVMISTTVGSISMARNFAHAPTYQYKITKAALNMLLVQYALAYEEEGFTVIGLSPGYLKTDMGTDGADLDVHVGAAASKDVILKADRGSNGKLLNIFVPGWENAPGPNRYDGEVINW